MIGTLISGDLKDNTLTFEMEEDAVIKAGRYTITEERNSNDAISLLRSIVEKRNDQVSWDELSQSIHDAETFLSNEN